MRAGGIAAVLVAGVLVLAGCDQPGVVVRKSYEGYEVTGNHFVWCKRGDKTVKLPVGYKTYAAAKAGDPC